MGVGSDMIDGKESAYEFDVPYMASEGQAGLFISPTGGLEVGRLPRLRKVRSRLYQSRFHFANCFEIYTITTKDTSE